MMCAVQSEASTLLASHEPQIFHVCQADDPEGLKVLKDQIC